MGDVGDLIDLTIMWLVLITEYEMERMGVRDVECI